MAFDFNLAPEWWPVCQNADCPQSATCLRYVACQNMPPMLTVWPCVMSGAMKDGSCSFFVKNEKVRFARGFKIMFARVKSRDDIYTMRRELTDYLGSKGTYYRYKYGEKPLSPEQQQWILRLFAQHGYTEGLEFDEYIDGYDFKRTT